MLSKRHGSRTGTHRQYHRLRHCSAPGVGPGLLESAYVGALCIELAHRRIAFQRQLKIPLQYRGESIGDYFIDLVVENTVVVEIKSVVRFEPVFAAQVLTYMRITGLRVGLLLNFNKGVLKDGIKRFVL